VNGLVQTSGDGDRPCKPEEPASVWVVSMCDLASETFGGTWPYAPRFFDHDRVKLHYVDEGDGEPIGLGYGVEHADRIKRLVILNTWAFLIADGMPLALGIAIAS
jgi:hypothetical protein